MTAIRFRLDGSRQCPPMKLVVATVVTGFRHRGTTSRKSDGNFAIDANIAKKPGHQPRVDKVKVDVSDELRVTTDGAVRIVTINRPMYIDKVREFLGADKYDVIETP